MIAMSLLGVRVDVTNNLPIVLLREEDGARYLPIFIGAPEATAIVYALQGTQTPRPMTHDLFTTVLGEVGATLEQVEITGLDDGTFFAELTIRHPVGVTRISARPSDAIALAVRQDHPVTILAAEAVLDEAGVLYDPADEADLVGGGTDAPDLEEFHEFIEHVSPEDFLD